MEPGMQTNIDLIHLSWRTIELTCLPENFVHDVGSASPQDIFGSNIISTTPPSLTLSDPGSSSTSTKVYVLLYNTTVWTHKETTGKNITLDGTPITVAVNEYISPATVQPVGVIGVYSSEEKAKKRGKWWLYDQLMDLRVKLHLPLPDEDGSEATESDWRTSGWRGTADGSWRYTLSNHSRDIGLTVLVAGRPVVDENNDDDDDDGGGDVDDDEYRDSDDDAGGVGW